MEAALSTACVALADAFCYPAPGRLEALRRGQSTMPAGASHDSFTTFIRKIGHLSLGEWEELHTRTLDLNPPAAPYIGYQTWGESYQRGAFLAKMNRALAQAGVDSSGELPDHLTPTLRYLAVTPTPLPELVAALEPALQRMLAALRQIDPENPYINLLQSTEALCHILQKETV